MSARETTAPTAVDGPSPVPAGPITVGEALAALAGRIPAGRAVSYGGLAGALGVGGPRQAGRAMAEADPGTPWWRVVRADGSLPADLVRRAAPRWADEGTPVRVGPSGAPRVDLAAARWKPDDADLAAAADLAGRVG